jgi:hypothetical protein
MFKKLMRLFANAGAMASSVIAAVVTVVVIVILDTSVVPILINGEDGGIGEQTLPLIQTGLLIAAIFCAIGIIVYAAKHSFSGSK